MEQKKRYKYLLNSAKSRGISVNITTIEYDLLIESGCIYCGESLSDKQGVCLDRDDSSKGYIEGNAIPCCLTCNIAKNTMGFDEFYNWIGKVFHFSREQKRLALEANINQSQNKKNLNVHRNSKAFRNSRRLILKEGK